MDAGWTLLFMLVVLKIPLVYLGVVIWYAVKEEPAPEGGGEMAGVPAPIVPCGWGEWRDRRLAGARGRRPIRPRGRQGDVRLARAARSTVAV